MTCMLTALLHGPGGTRHDRRRDVWCPARRSWRPTCASRRRRASDEISLRRLGSELGVDPTVVYRHVRDKGRSWRWRRTACSPTPPRGSSGTGHWREDLAELYRRVRRYTCRIHARSNLQLSPAVIPAVQRLSNTTIEWLRAGGLDHRQAALAFELLESYTLGTALFDAGMTQEILDGWRRSYATDPDWEYPYLVATAPASTAMPTTRSRRVWG